MTWHANEVHADPEPIPDLRDHGAQRDRHTKSSFEDAIEEGVLWGVVVLDVALKPRCVEEVPNHSGHRAVGDTLGESVQQAVTYDNGVFASRQGLAQKQQAGSQRWIFVAKVLGQRLDRVHDDPDCTRAAWTDGR